jgi:UDP-N-acetylmuramoyl-tripeptide--D-alanyl-D-alanine ligase
MIDDIVAMIGGKTRMSSRELVRHISIHSQAAKPGSLFFALKGEHTDGHFYAKEALDNGACGVVVETSTGADTEIIVRNSLFALGTLAQHYWSFFKPTTIGITGTNGKTTVKNLVAAVLSKNHRVVSSQKNYNSLIGLPLTLFALSGDEDYLVVEMGTNSPGEIRRLCEIARPTIGLITTIGPGHLEGLGTLEGIRQEKLSLIASLPQQGIAVVGDGVGAVAHKHVTRFSLDMLEDVTLLENGSHFIYRGAFYTTPLLGIGNVYNCLAAICLASQLGIPYEVQRDAIAVVGPEPGRMEPLYYNNLLIIDDTYNANPASMRAAIDFVASLPRRKIFVLGDMRELGKQSHKFHSDIGAYARARCDLLVTHGDTARQYRGKHFHDRYALTRYIVDHLTGDEVILVKASRALHFEDIVKELLRKL